MAAAELKLDDKALEAVVSAAILQQLGDPATVVAAAIDQLMRPLYPGGNDKRTALSAVFANAVELSANRIITAYLNDSEEFRRAVEDGAKRALVDSLGDESTGLAAALAAVFSKALQEASTRLRNRYA